MKRACFLFYLLLVSCKYYHGKPVPLGDEFEDHWQAMVWSGAGILDIEPSRIARGEFFIIAQDGVWQIQDTIVRARIFSHDLSVTCLASSFTAPSKLLIGTASSFFFVFDIASGLSRTISVPALSTIFFIDFSPTDPQIFYVGDKNLLLRTDTLGASFDTIFYAPNGIVNFVVGSSGKLFAGTGANVCVSSNQGGTWDTIFSSSAAPIRNITIDADENIYLAQGETIFISQDYATWHSLFDSLGPCFSFAGLKNGLVMAHFYVDETDIEVFKIDQHRNCFEISQGIVFESYYDEPNKIIIATNQDEYLLTVGGFEEGGNESYIHTDIIFYFYDTSLPP